MQSLFTDLSVHLHLLELPHWPMFLPKVGLQTDKMRPALRDDQDLAGFEHVFPEKNVVDDDLV